MDQNNKIIELTKSQIQQAADYIPGGMLIAAALTLMILAIVIFIKKSRRISTYVRIFFGYFFLVYAYVLLQLTLLSRSPGNFGGIDWRILARWQESDMQKAFFIANILLFIPMGMLFPGICRWMSGHIVPALLTAFLTSAAIEAIQLHWQLGFCQLDDVFANMTGFLAGYILFLIAKDLFCFVRMLSCMGCHGVKSVIEKNRRRP